VEEAPGLLYADISTAFQQFLPALTLVDVVLVDRDDENGSLEMEIEYQIPQTNLATQTVGITLQGD